MHAKKFEQQDLLAFGLKQLPPEIVTETFIITTTKPQELMSHGIGRLRIFPSERSPGLFAVLINLSPQETRALVISNNDEDLPLLPIIEHWEAAGYVFDWPTRRYRTVRQLMIETSNEKVQ